VGVLRAFSGLFDGTTCNAHRRVLEGIFWMARTGAGWRDLPVDFGKWNSVWRQFRRWALLGGFDAMLRAFADSGGDADMLQMIDSTVIRAHRCAVINVDHNDSSKPKTSSTSARRPITDEEGPLSIAYAVTPPHPSLARHPPHQGEGNRKFQHTKMALP
jgi:transposase